MSKSSYDKIYGEHFVISYNPRTKYIYTAWGRNIEEEITRRGLKYWLDRYYYTGWIKVYNDEIKYQGGNK